MIYHSIIGQSERVDFREATLNGQAPDKGLYFPDQIPVVSDAWLASLETRSDVDTAFEVIRPYVGQTISDEELFRMVGETIDFPIPLVPIGETISSLELFHGPTLAFKDIGARFMSRCLGHFLQDTQQKTIVLVATSGDTGGAVADGFFGVPGIDVVILYPRGKVSIVQEKQLTTRGGNIHALEIDGNFDDCQKMVKEAFADPLLRQRLKLVSANSINVARWLSQQFYYFLAYKQWPDKACHPVVSVPSGNFGNICAGMLAQASGLPLGYFIAACNDNDTVTRYLQTGDYAPGPAKQTLSNAMDVAAPSNLSRVEELYGHAMDRLRSSFHAVNVSDEETLMTMQRVYDNQRYLLDPHGAVAYTALEKYLKDHPDRRGFFLETAHPVKFADTVKKATGHDPVLPQALANLLLQPSLKVSMEKDYRRLEDFLLSL